MEESKLVTPKELALILKVPISWIYQRTRLGVQAIPHIKMGKYIRFDPGVVLDFFKNQNK